MSGEDELINQDEIEQLLNSGGGAGGSADSAKPAEQTPAPENEQTLDQGDIEAMLNGNTPAKPAAASTSAAPAVSTDDDKLLGQDDIEKLLNKSGKAPPAAEKPAQAPPTIAPAQTPSLESVQQGDVEYLLNQAQAAIESITTGPAEPSPHGASQFKLETFSGVPASTEAATLDLIRDVDLDLKIELGRTHMYLEDVLKLNKGSVVPLDKMAGDPVDIYVNGRLIARGEVLVMNDNFCVRVAELIAGEAAG